MKDSCTPASGDWTRIVSRQIKIGPVHCTVPAFAHHHLKEVFGRRQMVWVLYSIYQSWSFIQGMEGVLHVYPLIFCLLVGSFIYSSIYSFIQYLIIPQHITVLLPRVKMFALRSSQSSWGGRYADTQNASCEYLTGDNQRLPKETEL